MRRSGCGLGQLRVCTSLPSKTVLVSPRGVERVGGMGRSDGLPTGPTRRRCRLPWGSCPHPGGRLLPAGPRRSGRILPRKPRTPIPSGLGKWVKKRGWAVCPASKKEKPPRTPNQATSSTGSVGAFQPLGPLTTFPSKSYCRAGSSGFWPDPRPELYHDRTFGIPASV